MNTPTPQPPIRDRAPSSVLTAVHPGHTVTRKATNVRRRARQRGSVYLLILGVCSIIMVIGLSAMAAVRIQHRGTAVREDAAQAQQLADAALQIVFARLGADAAWRTSETHDAWSTAEPTGIGAFQYRLVDEDNGDLTGGSIRLYTRAAHGDAVRLASVELRSTDPVLGSEIVTNGDMEAASIDFEKNLVMGTVNAYTDSPHGGTRYLQLEGRGSALDAWQQRIDGLVDSDKTYRVSAWMRLEDSPATVEMGLYLIDGMQSENPKFTVAGDTSWFLVESDLTPSFAFTPTFITVYGKTASGSQDIHFDDVSVRELITPARLAVVRGSYRRELNE